MNVAPRPSVPYAPPVDEIVRTIGYVQSLTGGEADADAAADVLGAFARVSAEVIAPSDVAGDLLGARLDVDGSVTVPAVVAQAYRAVVDGGWAAAAWPENIGGGGLHPLVATGVLELLTTANVALSLNSILTHGAVRLLAEWGTPAQRQDLLPHLVSGQWSGTMMLTEPDAGSDVGALRTRARSACDGTWRLDGTKIFVTWGEHDLAENIVHLVLARTDGAPAGSRGISLFALRKVLANGERNAVRCVALERKLGIHGSPTCVMQLEGAVGELVGIEHNGMPAMFTMMNSARLAIGMQGLASAERSWAQARDYALVRRQGRTSSASSSEPVVIAEHPDVRRMLADLRSTTRALRLSLYFVSAADAAAHADEAARRTVGLLTPVVKAWCTDEGVRLASVALQVHGGAGYVEDTGIAQRLRDARIGPIYEGTNGIQAVDLAVRKVVGDDGKAMTAHIQDLRNRLGADDSSVADDVTSSILYGIATVEWATDHLLTGDADHVLAAATPYLELVGVVTAGALLAGYADHLRHIADPSAPEVAADAAFFAAYRVRPATGLLHAVTAGAGLLPRFSPP